MFARCIHCRKVAQVKKVKHTTCPNCHTWNSLFRIAVEKRKDKKDMEITELRG